MGLSGQRFRGVRRSSPSPAEARRTSPSSGPLWTALSLHVSMKYRRGRGKKRRRSTTTTPSPRASRAARAACPPPPAPAAAAGARAAPGGAQKRPSSSPDLQRLGEIWRFFIDVSLFFCGFFDFSSLGDFSWMDGGFSSLSASGGPQRAPGPSDNDSG